MKITLLAVTLTLILNAAVYAETTPLIAGIGGAVDTTQISNALTQLQTSQEQYLGLEAKVYADVDVIGDLLTRCGCTLPAVTGAPGTPTYTNEMGVRRDAVMEYCADPAAISKVKSSITEQDKRKLADVNIDLTGIQAQLTPILTGATGAAAILQNAVLGLPAMIAGGGANVEELSKLLSQVTAVIPNALTFPARVTKAAETVSKLLAFIAMVT